MYKKNKMQQLCFTDLFRPYWLVRWPVILADQIRSNPGRLSLIAILALMNTNFFKHYHRFAARQQRKILVWSTFGTICMNCCSLSYSLRAVYMPLMRISATFHVLYINNLWTLIGPTVYCSITVSVHLKLLQPHFLNLHVARCNPTCIISGLNSFMARIMFHTWRTICASKRSFGTVTSMRPWLAA